MRWEIRHCPSTDCTTLLNNRCVMEVCTSCYIATVNRRNCRARQIHHPLRRTPPTKSAPSDAIGPRSICADLICLVSKERSKPPRPASYACSGLAPPSLGVACKAPAASPGLKEALSSTGLAVPSTAQLVTANVPQTVDATMLAIRGTNFIFEILVK